MAEQRDKGRLWIFPNEHATSENHPVKTGTGEISKEVIKRLVDASNASEDGNVKLESAAWAKVSRADKPYLFFTFDVKQEREPVGRPDSPSDDGDIPF